jgi:exopolyphosphatase/pppGpp-phosphohydrolase
MVAAIEPNCVGREDCVNVGLLPIRQVTHRPQGIRKGVFVFLATRQQAREHRQSRLQLVQRHARFSPAQVAEEPSAIAEQARALTSRWLCHVLLLQLLLMLL